VKKIFGKIGVKKALKMTAAWLLAFCLVQGLASGLKLPVVYADSTDQGTGGELVIPYSDPNVTSEGAADKGFCLEAAYRGWVSYTFTGASSIAVNGRKGALAPAEIDIELDGVLYTANSNIPDQWNFVEAVLFSKDGLDPTKTYTIKLTNNTYERFMEIWSFTLNGNGAATLSGDASLSGIYIDGKLVNGFASGTYDYFMELPYGVSQPPAVTASPSDGGAYVTATPAAALPGTAVIEVIPANGDISGKKTYTVHFTVASGTGEPAAPPAGGSWEITFADSSVTSEGATDKYYYLEAAYQGWISYTFTGASSIAVNGYKGAFAPAAIDVELDGEHYTVNANTSDWTPTLNVLFSKDGLDPTQTHTIKLTNCSYERFMEIVSFTLSNNAETVIPYTDPRITVNDKAIIKPWGIYPDTVGWASLDFMGTSSISVTGYMGPYYGSRIEVTLTDKDTGAVQNYKIDCWLPSSSPIADQIIFTQSGLNPADNYTIKIEGVETNRQFGILSFILDSQEKGINTDASLRYVYAGATQIAVGDFDAAGNYTMELPLGTTAAPVINAFPVGSGSTVTVTQAASVPGSTVINVTSSTGGNQKTYTINFTAPSGTTAPPAGGSLKIDCTDPRISLSRESIRYSYGIVSSDPSDWASLKFTGTTTVSVTGYTGPYYGNYTVTLVDNLLGNTTIDTVPHGGASDPQLPDQTVFTKSGLDPAKTYTITLTPPSPINSANMGIQSISLVNFTGLDNIPFDTNGQYVVPYNNPVLTYQGSPENNGVPPIPVADKGYYMEVPYQGYVSLTFTGATSVAVNGFKGTYLGKISVLLDGVTYNINPNSSDYPPLNVVLFEKAGLNPTQTHTIKLTLTEYEKLMGIISFTLYNYNIYDLSSDATLKEVQVDGVPQKNFTPDTTDLTITLPSRQNPKRIPQLDLIPNNFFAKVTTQNISTLPGTVVATVTSETGTTQTYNFTFVISDGPEQISSETSWLGNSFGGPEDKWVSDTLDDMVVMPDGTCYTNSGWDEAHRNHGIYKDNDVIGNQDMHISSKTVVDKNGDTWQVVGSQVGGLFVGTKVINTRTNVEIPVITSPSALAIANNGDLMVADNQLCQILFFDITTDPAHPFESRSRFGEAGGIGSGEPGVITPLKFRAIVGIGMDQWDNIYVGMAFPYVAIRCLYPNGELKWELNNTVFQQTFTFDPATNGADAYGFATHYKMDYTKTVPGTEATLVGYTLDTVNYPDDLRAILETMFKTTIVDYNGQKFMYAEYDGDVGIFKLVGERAIPAGIVARRPLTGQYTNRSIPYQPYGPSGGKPDSNGNAAIDGTPYIWTDNNGDGLYSPDEFTTILNGVYAADWYPPWYTTIDSNGNIWIADTVKTGRYDDCHIYKLVITSVNQYGVPVYKLDDSATTKFPPEITVVRRMQYDADTDTMYLSGFNDQYPCSGEWQSAGRLIFRYDNWSTTRTLHPGYPIRTAYGAIPGDWLWVQSFTVTDDLLSCIYIAEGPVGYLLETHVYDDNTTEELGFFHPSYDVVGQNVGWADIPNAINGMKMPDGSYKIFVEEVYRARQVLMTIKKQTAYAGSWEGAVDQAPTALSAKLAPGESITVDGNLNEPVWDLNHAVEKQILTAKSNNQSAFGTHWDDTYLYIGVQVLDSALYGCDPNNPAEYAQPYLHDDVEIFIDGNNNKAGKYDASCAQIVVGYNNTTLFVNSPNAHMGDGVLHGVANITGGFTAEIAIPWANMGVSPTDGVTIGFDVANGDDFDGKGVAGYTGWNGPNYLNSSNFGNLQLTSAVPNVDKTALKAAISQAVININTASVSVKADGSDISASQQWVTSLQMTAYKNAIKAATAVTMGDTVTQDQINQAILDLNAATDAYNAAKQNGSKLSADLADKTELIAAIAAADRNVASAVLSEDGSGVTGVWVTIQDKITYINAINEAKTVRNKLESTQEEVDRATADLVAATGIFDDAKLHASAAVDKSALAELIALADGMSAETLATYTLGSAAALQGALNAAKVVYNNAAASQIDVERACAALRAALGSLMPAAFTCAVKSMLAKVAKPQKIPFTWTGGEALVFSSSNTAVCNVTPDGTLVPMKAGVAVITITVPGGVKYVFAVTITV